ncbi:myb/SANT-like DNA-binding domain-containing protein 3 isoform X2 [Aricia agestis]|uniref:myb/SANT-like DNA-binding domain-containing protein 3 isoform X2 n=1 Tax=Aricia agestis TaxID=91739 RepID=UPI001C201A5F|nr:myb/SANT-like DNA-binding domain-containing protein 3 isoform X2 [Aricia agestis]
MSIQKKKIFSFQEKKCFLEILKLYTNIIENKETDTRTLQRKNEAWEAITLAYNASPHTSFLVTSRQLRRLWMNLKQRQREAHNKKRQNLMAVGGGPSTSSIIADVESAIDSDTLAKKSFSSETSRPSSPQSEYPIRANHTVEPQVVNDKKQEEHENNETFTYLKGIKELLEKTLDKEESRRDNLRPKRRLMQEASVNKQKAPQSSNAFHEEIDGDKHFALSLVPTLKQMNDDQKLAAKMRILQTLQEVRKMNIHQNIMYVEDNMEDALKVEYLDEDNSDSSFS